MIKRNMDDIRQENFNVSPTLNRYHKKLRDPRIILSSSNSPVNPGLGVLILLVI